MSKTLKAIVLLLIIGAAAFSVYAAATYPRSVVGFQVSFTIGADLRKETFEVPAMNDRVQMVIKIESGTSLWYAEITSGNEKLWKHSSTQKGQTTHKSEWIQLPSGTYNFTFGTVGFGSLQGEVEVVIKGGFW